MTLYMALLPLRVTTAQPLAAMLGECRDEWRDSEALQELERLRNILVKSWNGNSGAIKEAVETLSVLKEYYQRVLEAETKAGFPSLDDPSPSLQLQWQSALSKDLLVESSLTWERANLLWNWACIETYLGCSAVESEDDDDGSITNTREAWNEAAQHIQTASCLVHQLQQLSDERLPSTDFSYAFLEMWKSLLVAQAQRCAYQSLACAPRPKYMLLAKVAAAAVPLCNNCTQFSKVPQLQKAIPTLLSPLTDYARAWGMWWSSQAELDQANLQRDKKEYGVELARLELAQSFAQLCCEFCESAPIGCLQSLRASVEDRLSELQQRRGDAQIANEGQQHKPVPHRQGLPEIRGQRLVNFDQPIEKQYEVLKGSLFDAPPPHKPASSRKSPPVAGGHNGHRHQQASAPPSRQFDSNARQQSQPQDPVSSSTNVEKLAEQFCREVEHTITDTMRFAQERSDAARSELSQVNLPHSITAYRQERSGGGIPDDLWARVSELQESGQIAQLKQELWGLRDVAEQAKSSYDSILQQLDFDIESDRLFRQEHTSFEGHDTEEVQRNFRQSLATFDRLLKTANEGDTVLLGRLETLDTNPRYKLLQFQKAQLDRLLPASQSDTPSIDTSILSQLLVDLSTLLRDRDAMIEALQREAKAILANGPNLLQRSDPSEYNATLHKIRAPVDALIYDMQKNLDAQNGLVDRILAENETFVKSRNQGSSRSGLAIDGANSCIAMIGDALEEIEQLHKHLEEGKDFYNVVIPKLTKLQQQVSDVSARLAAERLEYEDHAQTSRQEQADAAMAHRMSAINQPGSTASSNPDRVRPAAQPGFHQVSHDEVPPVQVDDEKVATLVAMEFDPTKVVAALAKYDNNVDQALNELLSG